MWAVFSPQLIEDFPVLRAGGKKGGFEPAALLTRIQERMVANLDNPACRKLILNGCKTMEEHLVRVDRSLVDETLKNLRPAGRPQKKPVNRSAQVSRPCNSQVHPGKMRLFQPNYVA